MHSLDGVQRAETRGTGGRGLCHAGSVSADELGPDESPGWTWDSSLYAGSADFYAVGRAAYPPAIAARLRDALRLDGHGRLLDVGCGPGSLTMLLAPLFAEAIGVDADVDMLAVAARLATDADLNNVAWRHLRAEDLPADLPEVHVVTFAQSFHWMDRPRVASTVRSMVAPGGALVHVSATTHEGVPTYAVLPHPQPPRAAIDSWYSSTSATDGEPGGGCCRPGHPEVRTPSTGPPASPGPSGSRWRAGSSSAPPTRWPRRSTRCRAPHRNCLVTVSTPSTPTCGSYSSRPAQPAVTPSRWQPSPSTSGADGVPTAGRSPTALPGTATRWLLRRSTRPAEAPASVTPDPPSAKG
jgi:hypothetical protein